MKALIEGGEVVESLRERILGRVSTVEMINPETGQLMFEANSLLDEDAVEAIEAVGLDEVKVRTPLTCETRYGLCARCYGRDLGRGLWDLRPGRCDCWSAGSIRNTSWVCVHDKLPPPGMSLDARAKVFATFQSLTLRK